ncbi:MAG: hypothetical protein R6V35_01340 [Candidatus Nanohaloarchaea archaeon]
MDRLAKIGIAIGVFAIVLVMVLVGLAVSLLMSLDTEPENFSHQIEYSAELRANGTLNDTEILLPYPEDERFRNAIENSSQDPNVTISNDFNASTSITDSGYLRLDIGDFGPETRDERFGDAEPPDSFNESGYVERINVSGIREYSSYDFYIRIDYNRSINTSRGLTEEPHLISNTTECQNARESGCATTQAYMNYEAGNETYLEFDVGLEGRNSWNEGFSWRGNSYRQDFYNSYYDNSYLIGSQDRWVELTGREVEGDGVYRRD